MTGLDKTGSCVREPEFSEGAIADQLIELAGNQPVQPGTTIDVGYPTVQTAFHKYLESVFGGYLIPRARVRYVLNAYGIAEVDGIEVDFMKKEGTKGSLHVNKDLSLVDVAVQDGFSRGFSDLTPRDIDEFLGAIPDDIHSIDVDPSSPNTLYASLEPVLEKSSYVSVSQVNTLKSAELDDFSLEVSLGQTRVIGEEDIFTSIKFINSITQPSSSDGRAETRKDELELYSSESGITLALNHVDADGTPHVQPLDFDRILRVQKLIKSAVST